jgi:hypothetical protein
MIGILQKIAVVGLAMAVLISFYSCAHTDSSGIEGPQTEVWDMRLTGDTVAQYKMLLNRTEIEREVYSIDGKFSGMAHDHIGGGGMVECTYQGKITGNNLKADFIGTGNMITLVHLTGSFRGTLSGTEGKGKYHLSHGQGSSKGEWSLKRIKTPK